MAGELLAGYRGVIALFWTLMGKSSIYLIKPIPPHTHPSPQSTLLYCAVSKHTDNGHDCLSRAT